jgi:soluble cytochrome b562
MSTPTEDDLETIPDGELLTLPSGAIPPGWLSEFFGRRAALIHQQDTDELALELSGDSTRHLMIFPGMDAKEKRRREEEGRRSALLAEQEMLEYRERSDRLLAQIDQQQRVVEKRRKEIEDSALKLHDGRRVYVDGDLYRDEQGRVLEGMDRDEAATLHSTKPDASTWRQKNEIDDRFEELKRMKQKVLDDREQTETGGQDLNAATDRLSADEKEFAGKVEARAQQAPVDYGSADYMAAFGDEYTISTVPAFTKAADGQTVAEGKDTETENPQTQNAPRPVGQITPKI